MPIPTPADFRNKSKKHSEVREMLAQMAGNVDRSYNTLAEANANIANIPVGPTIKVRSGVDCGDYYKESAGATALTKSPSDPQNIFDKNSEGIKQESGGSDAKLLTGIHELIQAILRTSLDLDALKSEQILTKVALEKEDIAINNRLVGLLMGLQQVVEAVATNVTETGDLESLNARLLVAVQQITTAIVDNRIDFDKYVSDNIQTFNYLNSVLQQLINVNVGINLSVATITKSVNELLIVLDGYFDEGQKLKRNYNNQVLVNELAKLDGFDPENAGNNKYVESSGVVFLPEPQQCIRIDVTTIESSTLPTAKGTVLNTLIKLNVDGQVLETYSTLEVQGSSSAEFPKKNWTFGFFGDANRENATLIKLGKFLPHDELVWKANFVDNTHSRNIAVNRLYDQMQLSRSGFPKREVDFVNMLSKGLNTENQNGLSYAPTGATGHVDGFPAAVYINQNFYGIGTLNIGKKRGNYNLKSNDQKHIQLEANGSVNLATMNIDQFEIRRPAVFGTEANDSFERFKSFMQMSQADMQSAGIDNYLNRSQVMDYIILCQVCDLWDHLYKNTLYTTWDGNVWHLMPYDLDTVFGLHFTGRYFDSSGNPLHPATNLMIPATGSNSNVGTLAKIRRIYGSDIDARYAKLRGLKIIDVDNIVNLCGSITRKFPTELLNAEDQRWNLGSGGIYQSLQQTGSIHQIHEWLSTHIPLVDTYFNYTA